MWRTDHFYWITAALASRGLQGWTCRVWAVSMAALGLIPVALISSRLDPQSTPARIAAAVVLVSCLAMSAMWLRRHWPSRVQSLIALIVGSLAIGTSALFAFSPIVGLLVTATFVVMTALTMIFHSARLLVVIWTIAAVVVGILFVRLAAMDLALALCATGVVVAVNVFVAFVCWGAITLTLPDGHHGDTDQITGLLNCDAFYRGVATLLASRSRSDDQYLVVVAVNIDGLSLMSGRTGSRSRNRARAAVSQALRDTVRRNAILARLPDDDFLIADTFTTADASPLVERIRGAIAVTPQRLTASIGVVCSPLGPLVVEPPSGVADKLIEIAFAAIDQARKAGGDQVRYILQPQLGEGEAS